jgi:hypothetical protein
MAPSITILCHYAECCVLFIIMLSAIMLNVIMLSVVAPLFHLKAEGEKLVLKILIE